MITCNVLIPSRLSARNTILEIFSLLHRHQTLPNRLSIQTKVHLHIIMPRASCWHESSKAVSDLWKNVASARPCTLSHQYMFFLMLKAINKLYIISHSISISQRRNISVILMMTLEWVPRCLLTQRALLFLT